MHLRSLTLSNFRCFTHASITFDPSLTVLVGNNGAGKSSVLDALAHMLRKALPERYYRRPSALLYRHDVVVRGDPTPSLRLECVREDREEAWISLDGNDGYDAVPPRDAVPLIAARCGGERDPNHMMTLMNETLYAQRRTVPTFVSHAVSTALGRDVALVRDRPDLLVKSEGHATPLRSMSDGQRAVIELFADIAWRCVTLGPCCGVERTTGVVLIDDVEKHLHPSHHRTILPLLREVFPRVQFIVTTHSPLVLSSIRASHVRVLDGLAMSPPPVETWGQSAGRTLEYVFNTTGRPSEVARKINALRVAVDADRFVEARQLLDELIAMVGDDDPDVFYFKQMLPPDEACDAMAPRVPNTYGRDTNSILQEVFGVAERVADIETKITLASKAIDEGRFDDARTTLAELATVLGEHDVELVRLRTMLHFMGSPLRD